MLPSPRLFRSRWWALVWAAGVLWTAYDVAGSAPAGGAGDRAQNNVGSADDTVGGAGEDALGDPVTRNDLDALANAIKN